MAAGALFNGPLQLLGPKSAHSPAGWRFEANYSLDRLVGEVTPQSEDLIGVTYRDPSGTAVYCYHSELADLALRHYTRPRRDFEWRLEAELLAPSSAAFEYGSQEPLEGVPLLLD